MIIRPVRICDRDTENPRLRLALGAIKRELPSPCQLAELRCALDRSLGSDALPDDGEASDSGVRRVPRGLSSEILDETIPRNAEDRVARPKRATRALLGALAVAALAALSATIVTLPSNVTPKDGTRESGAVVVQAPPPPSSVHIEREVFSLPAAREQQNLEPNVLESAPPPSTRPKRSRAVAAAPVGKIGADEVKVASLAGDETGRDRDLARVNINSIPISAVVLDGRPLGGTPRVGITVTPGKHTVVFIHPELGRKSKTIEVDAGRTVLAAVRFP
jgi:hypothetical protein